MGRDKGTRVNNLKAVVRVSEIEIGIGAGTVGKRLLTVLFGARDTLLGDKD